MKDKEAISSLLAQGLILHLRRIPKRLVLFRRIVKHSTLERVVEVKGLRHFSELQIVKDRLAQEGAVVTTEDPPSDSWTPSYNDRVVWRLQVQSTTWEVPTTVSLSRGSVQLLQAPHCDLCHSDDHHRSRCGWKEFLYAQ